jgi:hypothetical protein
MTVVGDTRYFDATGALACDVEMGLSSSFLYIAGLITSEAIRSVLSGASVGKVR